MKTIVIRPIITEKSIKEAEHGKFTFEVDKGANKTIIKKTIEKIFGVRVVAVATNILKGRTKRMGMQRREMALSSVKKAIVLLEKGQKIDIFDVKGA